MESVAQRRRNLLGARIRQARRDMPLDYRGQKVSQQDFADQLGVHVVTVSCWERGKYPPTLDNLMAISEKTDKPLTFFTDPVRPGEEEGDEDDEEAALRRVAAQLLVLGHDDLALDLLKVAQHHAEVQA